MTAGSYQIATTPGSADTFAVLVDNFRRHSAKVLLAAFCVLSASCNSASSRKEECSAYWLEVWNTRSDPQKWAYVDLSHYAQLGAHPDIPGFSSKDIAANFAALAIKNKQGLDALKLTTASEDMRKLHRAGSIRDSVARFYGVTVPLSGAGPHDKCIYGEASVVCLPGLTRELLPKAEKMQQYLATAIRAHRLGDVPCTGSIKDFGNPNFR
ncbi:hypothetical protein [Sinorhizobium sp. A49]|uniref:hypothetical protein n=1 Tax=Sinorhizobium sp. A49 TaxID=1945861 RepID=UPI0011154B43|nr:hypothetical protein [Sinorhizobium sp. A49]